jgi:hypothetical protein
VISSGQPACERAAVRAARAPGLDTGGWAPWAGAWRTASAPAIAGGRASESTGRPGRVLYRNVRDADATLWLGRPAQAPEYVYTALPASTSAAT